jgi:acyl carrier protein
MDIKATIRGFIIEHYLKEKQDKTITDDGSFLDEGIIDSVGVLELVAFLEEAFGLRVEDEELVPENLDSVERLVTYVGSKLAVVESKK